MDPTQTLIAEVKQLLVSNLMLQVTVDQIGDEVPLFGPGGLGLDSVDALQIVVAVDKHFGLKIPDPATAKLVLQSVATIASAVAHQKSGEAVEQAPQ